MMQKLTSNSMVKVLVWGMGDEYDRMLNRLKFEEYKRNLEVTAVVSDLDSRFHENKDGWKVISKDELAFVNYDCVIICSSKYFEEIKREVISIAKNEVHIMHFKVFELPGFDFARYYSLVENPVTILCDDCFGGHLYHYLGLPFSSPLINIQWDKDEFLKFAQKPLYYLDCPLVCKRDSDIRKGIFALGELGTETESVYMELIHSRNFEQAKEEWDRRIKRINRDRIFFVLGLSGNDKDSKYHLEQFEKIKYPKVCFYSGSTDKRDVYYSKRYEWQHLMEDWVRFYDFSKYTHLLGWLGRDIDYLKLLNCEDYIR